MPEHGICQNSAAPGNTPVGVLLYISAGKVKVHAERVSVSAVPVSVLSIWTEKVKVHHFTTIDFSSQGASGEHRESPKSEAEADEVKDALHAALSRGCNGNAEGWEARRGVS